MSNRQEKFRIVSVNDPAIESERMPINLINEYHETRAEKVVAPYLNEAAKPTWFHIGEISRKLMTRYVRQFEGNPVLLHECCFRVGLLMVENLHQDDGVTLPTWTPPRNKDGIIPEDVIEARFSPSEVDEVGSVIWTNSFLARRMRRTYLLPLTSREALSVRDFLPAAVSPSLPATSSGEASPEPAAAPLAPGETAIPSATSASGFANHTDVTAVETRSTAA